jgi:CO/xanthine dehydrogenase Mo-binding subunit
MSGGAVHKACREVREELFERIRRRAVAAGSSIGGEVRLEDGMVVSEGAPIGSIEDYLADPIERIEVFHHEPTEPMDENGQGKIHVMIAFCAERAVVEVDSELGLVRVVQVNAVQEVGKALNPQAVYGQIEGGTAQGLGLALLEEVQVTDGKIRNASFTDYLIPTILDMPPVVSEIIEEPAPGAPFGAKGVGEPSTIVSSAAVAAALRDATGKELNRIPVKPDDLVGLNPPVSREWPPSPVVPGPRPIPYYVGLEAGQHELGGGGGKG